MCRCNSRCCCRNSSSNCRNRQNNDYSSMYSNICQNTNNNAFPENYLYGHAYTPVQTLNNTYNPEMGLQNGSIFPELVSPYSPGQSIDFIEFLRCGGRDNG